MLKTTQSPVESLRKPKIESQTKNVTEGDWKTN